jgi:hypothetical protein
MAQDLFALAPQLGGGFARQIPEIRPISCILKACYALSCETSSFLVGKFSVKNQLNSANFFGPLDTYLRRTIAAKGKTRERNRGACGISIQPAFER